MIGASPCVFNYRGYFLCVSDENREIFVGFLAEKNIMAIFEAGYVFDPNWVLLNIYVRERQENEQPFFLYRGMNIFILPIGKNFHLPEAVKDQWLILYKGFFEEKKREFSKIIRLLISRLGFEMKKKREG
jgi:hypothetical protein